MTYQNVITIEPGKRGGRPCFADCASPSATFSAGSPPA